LMALSPLKVASSLFFIASFIKDITFSSKLISIII